jgi:hypothetical protein
MTEFNHKDDSIEGSKLEGKSRKRLINRGLTKYNTVICYRFTASFDVKAEITAILKNGMSPLEKNSHRNLGDNIQCESVIIHTKKEKYFTSVKEGQTGKHGANLWRFSAQSLASIQVCFSVLHNVFSNRIVEGL